MLGAVVTWWWAAHSGSGARVEAPRPETRPDSVQPFPQIASALAFPVRVDVSVLLDQVERRVPVEWGTVDQPIPLPDSGRTRAAIALQRSPFRASLDGTTARLGATVYYGLVASVDLPLLPDLGLSCGTNPAEPRPRLDVLLEAPISLTSDWRLATESRIVHVAPASATDRDRCEVTFAGVDITGRVVESSTRYLTEHLATIDSVAAAADIRSRFVAWWDELRDPIELGPDIWLELRPVGVRQGEVRGLGDVIEIRGYLEALPRVVFGPRPERWAVTLPELGTGVPGAGLQILVEGVAQYSELSSRLAERMGGLSVGGRNRRLEIESLEVSGIGAGRVAIEVRVRGDAVGTLFLVGTPHYAAEEGVVSMPDLGLTVSTSNLLVAGASWVLDAGLELLLRQRARWSVDFVVDWAEAELQAGLNSRLDDGVRLSGDVTDFRVIDVAATTTGLVVRATATGEATLTVREDG